MAHQFSRHELYELVWSEPRTVLAARLGVSDTGLAKACAKAGIPMPVRGHWARLAAGKTAAKAALPPRALGQSDVVEVGSTSYRQVVSEESVEAPPEPFFDEPAEAVRERAEALLLRCKVPKGLQNPHRLITSLLDEDQARRKAMEADRLAWQRPRFDSPSALRRLRIANALFIAMAHAGCQVSVRDKDIDKVGFRIGDTFVEVGFESSQKKAGTGRGRRGAPDGRLTLKAAGWPPISGVPAAWSETDAEPLEARILEIACDLLVMGELVYRAAVREQYRCRLERKQRLEAEAREARERVEQEERERRQRQEAERLEWLLGQATNLRRADEIRALVRAADVRFQVSNEPALNDTYRNWRRWALMQADLLDPRLGPLTALVGPDEAGDLGGLGETPSSRLRKGLRST